MLETHTPGPFPLRPQQLRGLVESAILAPSCWNTQPWRFRLRRDAVELFADRTRALPVNDPEDRELTLSCGAALYNLRLAGRNLGRAVHVALFPRAGEPDLLARVELGDGLEASEEEKRLLLDVPRRRTTREPFQDKRVPGEVLTGLVDAAVEEGAWIEPIREDARRRALAGLIAEGDEALWLNPSWRRERAMWMHPRRKGDGLPVSAITAPLTQALVGAVDMGRSHGHRDHDLAETAPLLLVLGTASNTPRDWLAAGQALQAVLLRACSMELQASFLDQPLQVALLRPRLEALVAHPGASQVILRLGYPAREREATPRRPLEAVIEPD